MVLGPEKLKSPVDRDRHENWQLQLGVMRAVKADAQRWGARVQVKVDQGSSAVGRRFRGVRQPGWQEG